jgi:hypothetical protein
VSDFIDDGYTEEGYIKADEGVHGALEFTYRPMLPGQRDKAMQHLRREPADYAAFHEAARKALAGTKDTPARLVSWNLKDRDERPVPITEANVGRIRARLFDKLWFILIGELASDPKPGADGQPVKSDVEGDGKN